MGGYKNFIRWSSSKSGGVVSRLGHPGEREIQPEPGWEPAAGEVWQVEVVEMPSPVGMIETDRGSGSATGYVRGLRQFTDMQAAADYCEAQIKVVLAAPITAEDEAWLSQQPRSGGGYYFCSCGRPESKVRADVDRRPQRADCPGCGVQLVSWHDVDCGPRQPHQPLGEATQPWDTRAIEYQGLCSGVTGREMNRVYEAQPGVEYRYVFDDELTLEQRETKMRQHRHELAVQEWRVRALFYEGPDNHCAISPSDELLTIARQVVKEQPQWRKIDQINAVQQKDGNAPDRASAIAAINQARKEAGLDK